MISRTFHTTEALPDAGAAAEPTGSRKPDLLWQAKQQLLEAAENAQPISGLIYRHPYLSVGAALLAGLMISRAPALRKLAGVAAVWGLKRAMEYSLRQVGSR